MKNVFVCLLNYNGKKNTLECLRSLERIEKDGFRLTIVVTDNASTDDSIKNIRDYALSIKNAGVEVIENKHNLGFSGGNNVSIKYSLEHGADYVLILNNDTFVDASFLKELLKEADKDNSFGILVPKIYFAPGFEFHKNKYSKADVGKVLWYAGARMDWRNIVGLHRGVDEIDKGQFNLIESTELATGCCMLIKKEVFEKIGDFNDKYFLYYEDADFSIRAKQAGFEIVYVPKSIIWHKNAESTGGSGSSLQDYYIARNRLTFGIKYAPIRSKLALAKESLSLLFNGRQWQRQGVKDYYLGKTGRGSYKV
jgi:GT2 family glycosyltransferase